MLFTRIAKPSLDQFLISPRECNFKLEKVFSILYIFIKECIVETTASQLQMLNFTFFTENSSQWLSVL